jgi:hypothetical protein
MTACHVTSGCACARAARSPTVLLKYSQHVPTHIPQVHCAHIFGSFLRDQMQSILFPNPNIGPAFFKGDAQLTRDDILPAENRQLPSPSDSYFARRQAETIAQRNTFVFSVHWEFFLFMMGLPLTVAATFCLGLQKDERNSHYNLFTLTSFGALLNRRVLSWSFR